MKRRIEEYTNKVPRDGEYVLAGDIGGTNANFGLCFLKNSNVTLIASVHYKSQEIDAFVHFVIDALAYINQTYGIDIKKACFAAAGVVSEDRQKAKPTNLNIVIDAQLIRQETSLDYVILINDFEAVGYGIKFLEKDSLVEVKKGTPRVKANKAVLGAGTGLGKSVLAWDDHEQDYDVIPSEGGHADFPAQDQEEFDLLNFIKQETGQACHVSWENVLSGNGIKRIYKFLEERGPFKQTSVTKIIADDGYHPDRIFTYCQDDELCNATYKLYARFYGRCAKNFALEALSLGGVFIAGGIAAKNIPLFSLPGFEQEFANCGKQMQLLQQMPIYVIADYNVSLYGAAAYLTDGVRLRVKS